MPTARFKDRRRAGRYVFSPAAPPLLAVQDEVRAAFGWALDADRTSAEALGTALSSDAPFGVQAWSPEARGRHLNQVAERCHLASKVVIVGAAATVEDVEAAACPGAVFIAADGAVGAVSPHLDVVAVVSDLDGGEHLDAAVRRGLVLVLHAHGDNRSAWERLLPQWSTLPEPPGMVLTHQTPNAIEGMHNPGGFTDGDRAACFLRWLGVPDTSLAFVGFALDRVGPWSGTTDPPRKLEKLTWMVKVLTLLGMMHEALPQDENS